MATRARSEKPTQAFAFVLVGGILGVLGSLLLPFIGIGLNPIPGYSIGFAGAFWLAIVSAVVLVIVAVAMHHPHKTTVHIWSTVALIFSILGLANSGSYGLMIIGFGLALIGSIMGITH
ncbi:MAG: hypothetical protein M1160_03240 [Candidatus Marsarchaeota archaeon]|jgi:hypothetical protein|nr:hypothetical protein [Candidatus Marsarchaeota archaeon]MCL5111863.1 hypothetical protein [Candidatus Marsarchaeota archaeon]